MLKNRILAMLGQEIVEGEEFDKKYKDVFAYVEKNRKEWFGEDYIKPEDREKKEKEDRHADIEDQTADERIEVFDSVQKMKGLLDKEPVEKKSCDDDDDNEEVDGRKKRWAHEWSEDTWEKALTELKEGKRSSVKRFITRIFTK